MPAKVTDISAAVAEMQPDWEKIDALVGGTRAMRAASTKFLPKFPMEDAASYDYRVKTSTLFNGLGHTLNTNAALPFSEALTWKDVDPVAEAWFEDIDLCGNNLGVFAYNVLLAGLKYGMTHMLVDHPKTAAKTIAEEKALGVRPYLVHIQPQQVLGWKSARINGKEVLTQVRLAELVEEDDGEFGIKMVKQIRVLERTVWSTYRANALGEFVKVDEGAMSLGFIPLVTYYTRRTGFMTAVPVFNDLADLNVKHWQSSSDQDSILHTARVPLLAISGLADEEKITIGAKSALMLPLGAEAKYVEHTGAAIEAGRDSLLDLESQMRAMGGQLRIASEVSSTATQNNIEDGEEKCQLSRMVEGLEDTLDNAIGIMHQWMKMDYKGSVDLFDDFSSGVALATAGPFLLALVSMVENEIMSKEDAFAEMQRYGIVNPDLIWDDVVAKIKANPPVVKAAAKDLQQTV